MGTTSQLVRDAQLLRVNEEIATKEFQLKTTMLVIVVYGKAVLGNKEYGKGSYFEIVPADDNQQSVRLQFIRRSAVFFLEKGPFESQMDIYETFYSKKCIMDQTLPLSRFRLSRRRTNDLMNSVSIVTSQRSSHELIAGE